MKKTTQFLIYFLSAISLPAQNFVNIAGSLNLNESFGQNGHYGGGVSFVDFNGDGWDDLSFGTQAGDSILFLINEEGVFKKIPSVVPHTDESKQLLWADYDNDGDKDLFVAGYDSPNRLYQNDGNLHFTDVTEAAGLPVENELTFGACFGDYNGDGWLDLYFVNRETTAHSNYLFENRGDGTFMDVTEGTGTSTGFKLSFSAVFLDYDNDGDQDLYVCHDKSDFANSLLKNTGAGFFEDVSAGSGADIAIDAMNIGVGDYDNDGDLDIHVSNGAVGNALLRQSNGFFEDVGIEAGVGFHTNSWAGNFLDFDNDRDLDLYVCSNIFDTNNGLFINQNDGTFQQTIIAAGDNGTSFSNAFGDFNQDGRLDLAVNNAAITPFRIWKNQTNTGQNKWLKIALEGTESNRDGIGSWIEVYSGGEKLVRYTHCGIGYLSQNSSYEHFGIGPGIQTIDSVIVRWLSGMTDKLTEVAVNQTVKIVEGNTLVTSVSEISASNSFSISSIFPNPTSERMTHFDVFSTKRQAVNLRAFDPSGRLVFEKSFELSTGKNLLEFPTAEWVAGTHFVVLKSKTGFATAKVVVP